jgi:hypothetical protein
VWQDFVHALVGLASASQNFDGNGYATRYLFGTGPDILSTEAIPGLGKLVTSVGSSIQSRPIPLGPGRTPPLNLEAPCSDQPVPDLHTPAGTSGLTPTGRNAGPLQASPLKIIRGLGTSKARAQLRKAKP